LASPILIDPPQVAAVPPVVLSDIHRALLDFFLLLRCERLYQRNHPRRLAALKTAHGAFRTATSRDKFTVQARSEGLTVAPGNALLPDARGEMQSLSSVLLQSGIRRICFTKKLRLEELGTLAELIKVSLTSPGPANTRPGDRETRTVSDKWWTARFVEHDVEGILVNFQVDRKVDTLLTSLIAALVAYGGNSARGNPEEIIQLPDFEALVATLTLLARITVPLEGHRGLSPEEGARAIHSAMEEARHDTVRLLLSAISHNPPEDGEAPQPYVLRLSESLVAEQLVADFGAGLLTPLIVARTFDRLGEILVAAGKFSTSGEVTRNDAVTDASGPKSFLGPATQDSGNAASRKDLREEYSSLAAAWAASSYRAKLVTRFWLELPPREKSFVLRGTDLWCVPVVALRQTLAGLADAGADAPRREARHIVLNYARRLDHEDPYARRAVASGLNELTPILESLWPNQLPEDLSRVALQALETEHNTQIAAMLANFLEWLGRMAVARADYEGFEAMLAALEKSAQDQRPTNLATLTKRLVAPDRWVLLVDAALSNRNLDPVLPRLLVRDPDRLLDRLTLMLGDPRGAELLPAMARLLRITSVPVLSVLETRLYEARPTRVTAAIKLLAAADPDRLLRGLARALPSWEWNMQDLAVSELARPANASAAQTAAFVFATVLAHAHPLVVPMMIDQIGLAGERSAIPELMQIASGDHAVLRDQFVRIKAIEALGRLRATEAIQLLHILAERRAGIAFAEPSGLRAAAQDALSMLEDRPASASVRATFDAPTPTTALYAAPRRYMRVPLEAPLRAQVGGRAAGATASLARVKTISLGGAYLEGPQKFNVGDSLKLEVRSGLRKIHCTAVVRNTDSAGGGVEFVHMNDDDRDKLRKLVVRNIPAKITP
jgi:hypothetical protein